MIPAICRKFQLTGSAMVKSRAREMKHPRNPGMFVLWTGVMI
jgi:hypothetical protein